VHVSTESELLQALGCKVRPNSRASPVTGEVGTKGSSVAIQVHREGNSRHEPRAASDAAADVMVSAPHPDRALSAVRLFGGFRRGHAFATIEGDQTAAITGRDDRSAMSIDVSGMGLHGYALQQVLRYGSQRL
jgi:hypothetical protein